jgi:diguanylate cyclase (GGDEF)-like protein/PAS domain S-box-containing protein
MSDFESINPTRLARCFDQSRAMVAVIRARDLTVVDVNDTFERLTGVARSEIVGLIPGAMGLWLNNQQRQSVRAQIVEAGYVSALPVNFHAANGQYGDGVLTIEPFQFAGMQFFIGFTQDVRLFDSPEKAVERPLADYSSFFRDADQGLYRIWPRRSIEANARLADLLGYESIPDLAQTFSASQFRLDHYVDAEEMPRFEQALSSEGRIPERRVEMRKLSGRNFWALESARAMRDKAGKVIYIEGRITDISAIDELRAASKRLEAKYRNVIENTTEGIFITRAQVVMFANPAIGELLGYETNDLIGMNYVERICAPADRGLIRDRINRRLAGETPAFDYEMNAIRADGSVRLVKVHTFAIELDDGPAVMGTMRDITADREFSNQLMRAQQRYQKLFDNATVGMFQISTMGAILEANRALVKMFGFDSVEHFRTHVGNVLPAFADEDLRELVGNAIEHGTELEMLEARMIHRKGHEFWVMLSVRASEDQVGEKITIEGSMQDISARRLAELQLSFQANHDSLTRMPNRARFESILREFIERLHRGTVKLEQEQSYWVLLLDLDGFKVVNDSLGHAAGDELLVMICDRLAKELLGELMISRYGGDEFAIVTRVAHELNFAIHVAERILDILSEPFLVRGQQIFATASIGIAALNALCKDSNQVMRDADTAMYRAKAAGKSRYQVFDHTMHRAAQDRLQIETDLRFAFERRELVTHYQPIVDLVTSEIIGAEALVRWRHPMRGLLFPSTFLSVAEESGALVAIDWFVIDQACRQMVAWEREFGRFAPLSMSVNISDRLFASRDFAGSLSDLIRTIGIDARKLRLEITETVFRADSQQMFSVLKELKTLGVLLIVDDFGTGYSSLASFAHASFDGLKIDRSFVEDIETNDRNRALVKTVCQFAKDLNLTIVCEGIERNTQAELVHSFGCAAGQGFRYAPAIPAEAFASRLALAQASPTPERPEQTTLEI